VSIVTMMCNIFYHETSALTHKHTRCERRQTVVQPVCLSVCLSVVFLLSCPVDSPSLWTRDVLCQACYSLQYRCYRACFCTENYIYSSINPQKLLPRKLLFRSKICMKLFADGALAQPTGRADIASQTTQMVLGCSPIEC